MNHAAVVVALLVAGAIEAHAEKVAFTRIGRDDYRNFIANWNDAEVPVFRALVRTPAEYDAVFHPARVMRDAKPTRVPNAFFEAEMLLVVARVVPAPGPADTVFEVDALAADGDTLELRYRFAPPVAGASFTVKEMLALRIPRRDVGVVRIIENGTPVGELAITDGRWSEPAVAEP